MKSLRVLNKNNRYLAKKVGIEIESNSEMMRELSNALPMLAGGNAESTRIYECQTVASNVQNPLEVVLLGEVTRRCLPNYVEGSGDSASGSAHCHISGIPTELSIDQLEVLMFALMPFMSMTFCRDKYSKYTYRAGVVGEGSRYSRFLSVSNGHRGAADYTERNTWVKDQTDRWGKYSLEFRANENSPLWLYFITSILNNSDIVNKMTAMLDSSLYAKATEVAKGNRTGSWINTYDKLSKAAYKYVRPRLLADIPNIVKAIPEDTREFMTHILTAYLNQDEETYDRLVNKIINAAPSIAKLFEKIDSVYSEHSNYFDVVTADIENKGKK